MHEGNIDDYLERRKREQVAQDKVQAIEKASEDEALEGTGEQSLDRKALRRERALLREKLGKKLNPLRAQVRKAEEQIERLEVRKQELETAMADPELYQDQERWAETSREYTALERRLKRNYTQWEEAQEKIEEIEASTVE